MPIKTTQFNFTSGELDPLLLGRIDVDKYYSAVETATNVLNLAQGGYKKFPGLEYIDRLYRQVSREAAPTITAPNGGTTANANDYNFSNELTTTNNISTTNPYVVVQYDLGSAKSIAWVDVIGGRLSAGSNSTEFFIQVSNDGSNWTSLTGALDLTTSDSTRRRGVRGSYRYVRLARIGSTDLGTAKFTLDDFSVFIESSSLSNVKLMPFEFSVTQSYMLAITDQNIAVYRSGVFQADVRSAPITNSIIPYLKHTQSADTAIFVQEDLAPIKLVRQAADDRWLVSAVSFDNVPRYDFDSVITAPAGTLTPSALEGVITLTASVAPPFSAASVGQYLQGGGGRARIISYTSPTVVKAVTEIPFFSTDAIAGGSWEYLTGFEDVWSSTRGYPKTATFHRGRLWLGGSKQRPQTIWGSKVSLYFDFDLGSLYDDEGIDATLDTDQINEIVNLKSSNGNLIIFTSGSEFVVQSLQGEGITPANFYPVAVSSYGSEKGFNVGVINNNNIFVQRGGKSIIRYVYDSVQRSNESENISLLSSHLVKNPVDFAIRKSTSTEESDLILFVDNLGKLIAGTVLFSQNVVGFSKRITKEGVDLIKNVGVDIADIYAVVQRTVGGSTQYYLERFDSDILLDSSVYYEGIFPTNTFSGLNHLEGETVKIIADGAVMSDEVVVGGSVSIERNATSSCQIGLDMKPTIKTLPLEVVQAGTKIGKRKRISEVVLRVYETGDFTINGDKVSFRTFGISGGGSPLDSAPPEFTGDKKVKGLLGYDERKQLTISQNEPAKFTLLSITMNVNL